MQASPDLNEDLVMDNMNGESKFEEPSDASPCNLMIKYLPERVATEESLRQLFSAFGEIAKVKLVCDKQTGRSKGYGFVKFVDEESAAQALDKMNGANLDGKIIRVNFANPMVNLGRQEANCYVAGIPQTWSKHDLQTLFQSYGTITDCRILSGSDRLSGQSKGVGFVRFNNYKDAQAAIKATDGTTPDGCAQAISVKLAKVRSRDNQKRVGVNTLLRPTPPSFGQFQPAPPFPFQFGSFPNTPAPPFPFQGMPPPPPQGKAVKVPNNDAAGLFVFHLPNTMDEGQLFHLFSSFGAIVQARVVRDPHSQMSKGYGFVNFETPMQAQAAINGLNGFVIGTKKLKVAFKQPKK